MPHTTVPLSLGLETVGGGVSRLISRGAPLPAAASEIFTSFVPGETHISLHVVTGERALAHECLSLARLELHLRPQLAGQARIGVKFSVSPNLELIVSATDFRTGELAEARMQPWAELDEAALAALLADAEAHAGADEATRQLIELRNEASALLAAAEAALLQPQAQAFDQTARRHLHVALDRVQSLIPAEDAVALANALADVNHAAQPLLALLQQR